MLDYKIYTFLTLCKCLNYRVTAEKLNMTQPAVTNHIKQLEAEYGCKLFIYKNRVLKRTAKADILESYARSAEYNRQKLLYSLSDSGRTILRVGATKTIGEFVINGRITELLSAVDIDLYYIVDNTNSLLTALRNGKLDLVFIEGYVNKEDFSHYLYKKEKLVGICSSDHPFAGNEISLEQVFAERLILREEGSGTREVFERLLTDCNYTVQSFNSKIQTNSFKTIIELVANNIGVSFVYESVAVDAKNISQFKIVNVDVSHEFSCIHLKNTATPNYIEYFL